MCLFGGGGSSKIIDPIGSITKKAPTPLRVLGLTPPTPKDPLPMLPKSAASKLLGE